MSSVVPEPTEMPLRVKSTVAPVSAGLRVDVSVMDDLGVPRAGDRCEGGRRRLGRSPRSHEGAAPGGPPGLVHLGFLCTGCRGVLIFHA